MSAPKTPETPEEREDFLARWDPPLCVQCSERLTEAELADPRNNGDYDESCDACATQGDAPLAGTRKFLVVRFEVTGLTNEEIDALACEAQMQGEENALHPASGPVSHTVVDVEGGCARCGCETVDGNVLCEACHQNDVDRDEKNP